MADEITTEQVAAGTADPEKRDKLRCGMIRPIADMTGYTASHWRDVHDIVSEAANHAGYDLRLVSESDAASVILSEIVTNIYGNEIVVADVSGRNPNVMFELGMRMAFQKPVVIITDDETPFSFDISPVKHLIYPKTLRFAKINAFKNDLASAINASVEAHNNNPKVGYLQQFGRIEVSELGTQHINVNDMAETLVDLQRMVSGLSSKLDRPSRSFARTTKSGNYAIYGGQGLAALDLLRGAEKATERVEIQCSYAKIDAIVNFLKENWFISDVSQYAMPDERGGVIALSQEENFRDAFKKIITSGVAALDYTATVSFHE